MQTPVIILVSCFQPQTLTLNTNCSSESSSKCALSLEWVGGSRIIYFSLFL